MQNKAYTIINENSQKPLILTCEHASANIPDEYNNLGLSKEYLNTHIARDKGCKELTCSLADKLGVTAFLGNYSRLLIDLNRRENEDETIINVSDDIIIPANRNISDIEKIKRIEKFYRPYHLAIENKLKNLTNNGITPVVFSIHSFTPKLKNGDYRPWNAGILYIERGNLTQRIISELDKHEEIVIGQNVPYDLNQYVTGSSVIHGKENHFDNCLIEIRDSEFDNIEKGVERWTNYLLPALVF